MRIDLPSCPINDIRKCGYFSDWNCLKMTWKEYNEIFDSDVTKDQNCPHYEDRVEMAMRKSAEQRANENQ